MLPAGKVFDRMSKGIREAPGKALIGDLAAESGDRTEGAFGEPHPFPCTQLTGSQCSVRTNLTIENDVSSELPLL